MVTLRSCGPGRASHFSSSFQWVLRRPDLWRMAQQWSRGMLKTQTHWTPPKDVYTGWLNILNNKLHDEDMIKTLHLYRRSPQCWRVLSSPQLSDQLRLSSNPYFFFVQMMILDLNYSCEMFTPPKKIKIKKISDWEAAPPGLADAYIDQRKRFVCLLKFVSFTSRGRKTPRNRKVWLELYLKGPNETGNTSMANSTHTLEKSLIGQSQY